MMAVMTSLIISLNKRKDL